MARPPIIMNVRADRPAPTTADGHRREAAADRPVARLLASICAAAGAVLGHLVAAKRRRHDRSATSLARALHDELVQSLIGTEMRVHAARRRAANGPAQVDAELAQVEAIIHEEILEVRDFLQRIRPIHVDADELGDFLADTVAKFGLDTGMKTRFVNNAARLSLSPASCAQLARIVQEALTNARKHSSARHVWVALLERQAGWSLVIEDDGGGLGAAGGADGRDASARCPVPALIKECVRSLRGELRVRSDGAGLRLDISIPRSADRALTGRPIASAAERSSAQFARCRTDRS